MTLEFVQRYFRPEIGQTPINQLLLLYTVIMLYVSMQP